MKAAPKLTGVLETSLYVADLDKAEEFYRSVFGFPTMVADERMRALAVSSGQVLLLFQEGSSLGPSEIPGGTIPGHGGSGALHLAFSIEAAELESWRSWLEKQGVALESEVRWPRGGISLYFRDPDDHSLELVTPGCWPNY